MEDSEHINIDTNGFNLIDFASENDNLNFASENDNLNFIASPLSHQHKLSGECQGDSQGLETVGDTDSRNTSQGDDQIEKVPELAQSEEPRRIGKGKCNLRKSLAWDNAFFTNAGVLDPEELTNMMDGKKQFLPGIQEDVRQSTDSISSLGSDSFTLESLEAELFVDIRASIQKSGNSAKGSFSKKTIQGGDQDVSSPNGDAIYQNQLKSKPVIRKVTGVHKIGVPKCQPKVNTGIEGSTKPVRPETKRTLVPRPAGKVGELTLSLAKPPKGISRSSSMPTTPSGTKVASVLPSRLKTDNTNVKTVSVRGSHASKTSSSSGPCRVLPKPVSTSQPFSRESAMAKRQSSRSSPKAASRMSSLSKNEAQSPLATVKRKAPHKPVSSPSPHATPQPPSRNALKSQATSKNSALAALLMSSKVPSSVSPSSSVSEWSSASSSYSAVNQISNESRSSFGSNSCRSLDGDALPLNLNTHADNQIPHGQEIKRSTESIRKPPSQTGVISGLTSMKPTGLRMPSPKIGFFDGAKSVRGSSGAMQSPAGSPMASSKVASGVSPRGIANIKHQVSKLPPGRVLTARKQETGNPDAPLPAQGRPQVTSRLSNHDKKMIESHVKVQKNGSGEHDEVSLKENLAVTKNKMVVGDDQDLCLKDIKLVDPEDDGKENMPCEDRMVQDEGGLKSGTDNLQTIEPLPVTLSEIK